MVDIPVPQVYHWHSDSPSKFLLDQRECPSTVVLSALPCLPGLTANHGPGPLHSRFLLDYR